MIQQPASFGVEGIYIDMDIQELNAAALRLAIQYKKVTGNTIDMKGMISPIKLEEGE